MIGGAGMLERITFDKFTAFEKLDIRFSPGINVFIGENGTGKTHVLKAAYAACDIAKSKESFAGKINNVFYPSGRQIGRLVKRSAKSGKGTVEVCRRLERKSIKLRMTFSNHTKRSEDAEISGLKAWVEEPLETAYIPVKDMIANSSKITTEYSATSVFHFAAST